MQFGTAAVENFEETSTMFLTTTCGFVRQLPALPSFTFLTFLPAAVHTISRKRRLACRKCRRLSGSYAITRGAS